MKQTIDIEDLAYSIASDPDIISKWALIAHSLGYGWCAGTKAQFVGKDFSIKRIAPMVYQASANYDPHDPKPPAHPKWDTRLKMTFDHVTPYVDISTMQFSTPVSKKLDPQFVGTCYAINWGPKEITVKKSISLAKTNSISHTTQTSFKNSISVKQKWHVGIPGLGGSETEVQYSFDSNNGWSDGTTNSTTTTDASEVTVIVPPYSKVAIDTFAGVTSCRVQYTGYAICDYHVTLNGFLRYDWNAKRQERNDSNLTKVKHGNYSVIDRPIYSYKFGTDQQSAIEHLAHSVKYASVDESGAWNLAACRYHEDGCGVFQHQATMSARKMKITGTFENVYGTLMQHEIGVPERLSPNDYNNHSNARPVTHHLNLKSSQKAVNTSRNRFSTIGERANYQQRLTVDHQAFFQSAVIWEEANKNHKLKKDGTVVRSDGSTLSQGDAKKFIKENHLQGRLNGNRLAFFPSTVIWEEVNKNHKLKKDGTVVRSNGSVLSDRDAEKFIREHHLGGMLMR